MAKGLSATKQWMLDHPNDTPPPQGHSDAQMWRRERGLEVRPGEAVRDALRAKYEAAMAEKREREVDGILR